MNYLANIVISDCHVETSVPHGNVCCYTTDVVVYDDCYPYGMVMPGRNLQANDQYAYGFQGQLLDDEIKGKGNSVNYKYRMHDSRVGRFFAADPLASKYPHNSPYAFSENRLIDGVELEGLEVEVMNKDGEIERGPLSIE